MDDELIAAKLGPCSCAVIVRDGPNDCEPIDLPDDNQPADQPSFGNFAAKLVRGPERGNARAAAKQEALKDEGLDASKVHGGESSSSGGGSSSSVSYPAVLLLPLGRQTWPPTLEPVPRSRVGWHRLRARDDWNLQELLLGEALAAMMDFSDGVSQDASPLLHCPSGIGSGGGLGPEDLQGQLRFVKTLLREIEEVELDDQELLWVVRLARRSPDSPAPLLPSGLRFGLSARHGLHSLPHACVRMLALFEAGSAAEEAIGSAAKRLQSLMQELNGGLAVSDDDVQMVLSEALLASGGEETSRSDLLKGLGAWYANVQRQDSPPQALFQAIATGLVNGREYHTALLDRLRLMLPVLVRDLRRLRKRDPGGFASGTNLASFASAKGLSGPLRQSLELGWSAAAVLALLLALALPSSLFAWTIYMGTAHGSDRCPYDLDGLL
ncbi:unnamed protein product, partial [Polarella glacialis]